MSKVYIVLDETNGKWINLTIDMISAVDEARQHHEHTKHETHIYYGELVGSLKEEELVI